MNFVTYKDYETADNNANYFLMHIEEKKDGNFSNFSDLEIRINNLLVIEDVKPNSENFPLFCFENGNVEKAEDLNLNNLKKFSDDCSGKYILVSLQDASGKRNSYLWDKSFNDWHNSNRAVKLTFNVNSTLKNYCGKISKIFHKQYKPTISTNNNSTP